MFAGKCDKFAHIMVRYSETLCVPWQRIHDQPIFRTRPVGKQINTFCAKEPISVRLGFCSCPRKVSVYQIPISFPEIKKWKVPTN